MSERLAQVTKTANVIGLLNIWERLIGDKMSNQFETTELIALNQDLVGQSTPEIMQRALEYATLAALVNPSKQQADHLGEILEESNNNPILNFWMIEVDHFLGHHLGLLDEDDRESYRDQQALLREYVSTPIVPTPEKGEFCPSF